MAGRRSIVIRVAFPLLVLLAYYVGAVCLELAFPDVSFVTLTVIVNLVVIAVYLVRHSGFRDMAVHSERKLGWGEILLAVGLLCLVWLFGQISASVVYLVTDDPAFAKYQGDMSMTTQTMALLLVFVAPFAEEILMRGTVYRMWRRDVGPWFAMLLSSLVFALMHGTLVHLIPIMMLGMLCALAYERTGSVWTSTLVHFVYNAMSSVGFISVPSAMVTPFAMVCGDALCVASMMILFSRMIGGHKDGKTKEKREEAHAESGAAREDAAGQGECEEAQGARGKAGGIRHADEASHVAYPAGAARCGDETEDPQEDS